MLVAPHSRNVEVEGVVALGIPADICDDYTQEKPIKGQPGVWLPQAFPQ